jgi:hypothetical protein
MVPAGMRDAAAAVMWPRISETVLKNENQSLTDADAFYYIFP